MSQKLTLRQRSWDSQCRFQLLSHQLVSLGLPIHKANLQSPVWLARTHFRSRFQLSERAASKKSPQSPPARCGINSMFGAIAASLANLCNAPKRLAINQLWSLLTQQSLVVASEMCVAVSRFHQKSVLKHSSTAFGIRVGHINLLQTSRSHFQRWLVVQMSTAQKRSIYPTMSIHNLIQL